MTNTNASASALKIGKENVNASTSATNRTQSDASNDFQRRLEEMARQLDQTINQKGSGSYLRLAAGETKVLLFSPDPTKYKKEPVTYTDKQTGRSDTVERMKFLVYEADQDGNISDDAEEEEWTISLTTARDVLKWMSKGHFLLDVERQGSTKRDTKYFISPHM
jgi:hypothetical protein